MSSYVLDRELQLLSACASARAPQTPQPHSWIDVNSNTALLGTTVYQRTTETDIRKQMADVYIIYLFDIDLY
jgi:hypothetical protein